MGDLLDVVEAAYRFDRDGGAWLQGVLEAVHPFVDQGFGAWGFTFDAYAFRRGKLAYEHPSAVGLPDDWLDGLRATLAVTTRESRVMTELMFGAPCHTMSALLRARPSVLKIAQASIALPGVFDSIGITARDPSGLAVFIGAHSPRMFELDLQQQARFNRIAAHIATASRLRRSIHPSGMAPASALEKRAEALIGPRGRVTHAQGQASTSSALETLKRAALAAEKAESLRKRAPDEALAIWEALVRGRWSIVGSYDDAGRRVLLAEPNEAVAPKLGEQLTRRERQIAGLLLMGHSDKLIAYDLGLSEGTISSAISRMKRKLGATSLAPLLRILTRLARQGDA